MRPAVLGTWGQGPRPLLPFLRRLLAPLLLVGGLVFAAWALVTAWREHLPPWQWLTLTGLLLLVLAPLLPRAWSWLFGPVLGYELLRQARQRRVFFLRTLFASVLLAVLFVLYFSWFGRAGTTLWADLMRAKVEARTMAAVAESFTFVFLGVQLAAVLVLTPAFTAGIIAEEKERRTLEFLLATDLASREIILGKWLPRVAAVTLLVLTGLPVLAILQFLGGSDPQVILAGFAATGLTLLSLAALGLLHSVYARQARTAIFLTYLTAGAYLLVSGGVWILAGRRPGLVPPSVPEWIGAGNLVVALVRLSDALRANTLAFTLPVVLGQYVLFHGLAALLCLGWSILHFRSLTRPIARRRAWTPLAAAPRLWRRLPGLRSSRPPVWDWALLWKEMYVENFRLPVRGRFLVVGLVLTLLLVAGLRFWSGPLWPELRPVNATVRLVGTLTACALLAWVALRAAGTFSGERDRQTLDGLLMTPLSNGELLRAKWLGSILGVRAGWWCLGAFWLVALAAGGLHPLAILLLLAAVLVYAAFLTGLGLCFSLFSRNTFRATVGTVLAMMLAAVGHWAVGFFVRLLLSALFDRDVWPRGLFEFQIFGLTPPATLGLLAFHSGDLADRFVPEQFGSWMQAALGGLACYAGAALLLWLVAYLRFPAATGRMPLPRSRQAPRVEENAHVQ